MIGNKRDFIAPSPNKVCKRDEFHVTWLAHQSVEALLGRNPRRQGLWDTVTFYPPRRDKTLHPSSVVSVLDPTLYTATPHNYDVLVISYMT
jgi:hypothetical protein